MSAFLCDSTHLYAAWYTCHTEEKSSEVLLSSVETGGVLTHAGSDYWIIANLFWSKKMSISKFGENRSGYSVLPVPIWTKKRTHLVFSLWFSLSFHNECHKFQCFFDNRFMSLVTIFEGVPDQMLIMLQGPLAMLLVPYPTSVGATFFRNLFFVLTLGPHILYGCD